MRSVFTDISMPFHYRVDLCHDANAANSHDHYQTSLSNDKQGFLLFFSYVFPKVKKPTLI